MINIYFDGYHYMFLLRADFDFLDLPDDVIDIIYMYYVDLVLAPPW